MSLETVPKDQRNLRACLLCSLVKVKIEFVVKTLKPMVVFSICYNNDNTFYMLQI